MAQTGEIIERKRSANHGHRSKGCFKSRVFCRWASGGVALNCYRGRLQASRCLRATSIAPVALKVWRASRRRALARPARPDEGRRGGNAHWPWPLSRPVLLPQSGGLARCGRGGTQESRRRVSIGRTGGLATRRAGIPEPSERSRVDPAGSPQPPSTLRFAGSRRARSAHAKARRRSPRSG